MTPQTRTKRRYDADDTRSRLVVAAKRAFTRAKFEDVSVREIAEMADANIALVNRYFGGKQGLFEAVFTGLPTDNPLEQVPQEQWPARLAGMMVDKMGTEVEFDPLLALLRSSQSSIVGVFVRATLEQGIMARMVKLLPNDPAAHVKTRALLALILGVDVTERMLQLPFDAPQKTMLRTIYQRAIEGILLEPASKQ